MSEPAGAKLTKKQKKAKEFRERKTKGGKPDLGEENDFPENEDQDMAEVEKPEVEVSKAAKKNKGKGKEDDSTVVRVEKPKKRKRDEDAATETSTEVAEGEKPKRRKKGAANVDDAEGEKPDSAPAKPKKKPKVEGKSKFILFLGNLKWTTSLEAIEKHFAICDPPPAVRLLTPKGQTGAKTKGCAFLEFTHRNALQQALKLHHTDLEGRQINVELTAGGGGRGNNRIEKVQDRNRALDTERRERAEKEAGDGTAQFPQRPQRFSATSGAEEIPVIKRTWGVAAEGDTDAHRGGAKHQKKRGAKPSQRANKEWSTGVNSMPLG